MFLLQMLCTAAIAGDTSLDDMKLLWRGAVCSQLPCSLT